MKINYFQTSFRESDESRTIVFALRASTKGYTKEAIQASVAQPFVSLGTGRGSLSEEMETSIQLA